MRKEYKMKSILALKERLTKDNTLLVQNEKGFIMETEFEWQQPATDEDIMNLENKGITLPDSYKDFLKISN